MGPSPRLDGSCVLMVRSAAKASISRKWTPSACFSAGSTSAIPFSVIVLSGLGFRVATRLIFRRSTVTAILAAAASCATPKIPRATCYTITEDTAVVVALANRWCGRSGRAPSDGRSTLPRWRPSDQASDTVAATRERADWATRGLRQRSKKPDRATLDNAVPEARKPDRGAIRRSSCRPAPRLTPRREAGRTTARSCTTFTSSKTARMTWGSVERAVVAILSLSE